jgi:hypothetical protein
MTDSKEIDLQMDAAKLERSATSISAGLKNRSNRKEVDQKIAKHTQKSWKGNIHVMINTAFTQKWMDVAAEHTQSNVKASLYDENVQLGFISALVLTMVFPLMYEFNIDWYEVAQTGFIARNTEYYLGINVFDEAFMGIWHDLSMAGYNWGVG